MKILFTNLILIFTCTFYAYFQTNNFSSLQGELVISLCGGITIPQTDFKEVKHPSLESGLSNTISESSLCTR